LGNEILDHLEIWVLGVFPVTEIPSGLMERINETKTVLTIEEHNCQCSMHETIAALLLRNGINQLDYFGLYSNGYPSGRYGSQNWHQAENNLAGKGLSDKLLEIIKHAGN
jgi:transketolase